jgi:hypothetical protein
MGAKNKRDWRMRERGAIFGTLERFGAISRTRGRSPLPGVKAEVI